MRVIEFDWNIAMIAIVEICGANPPRPRTVRHDQLKGSVLAIVRHALQASSRRRRDREVLIRRGKQNNCVLQGNTSGTSSDIEGRWEDHGNSPRRTGKIQSGQIDAKSSIQCYGRKGV